MSMTTEAAYNEVTGKNLEDLKQDVGLTNVQLKKLNVYTG